MEILFRGFNPYENGIKTITIGGEQIKGEWVKGDLLHDKKSGKFYIFGHTKSLLDYVINLNICEVLPETVGQYTGLTDKNGERIFVDDRVNGMIPEMLPQCESRNGTIVFSEYASFIVMLDKEVEGDIERVGFCSFTNCTVIGTKWDNPEMEEK